jgi:hypothetical protein
MSREFIDKSNKDNLAFLLGEFIINGNLKDYGVPHSYEKKSTQSYHGLSLKTGINTKAGGPYLAFREYENIQLADGKYLCIQLKKNDEVEVGRHIDKNGKMENVKPLKCSQVQKMIAHLNTLIGKDI